MTCVEGTAHGPGVLKGSFRASSDVNCSFGPAKFPSNLKGLFSSQHIRHVVYPIT